MNAPFTPPSHSLPGPHDVLRTQLSNGITLLVRRNPASPSVVIGGYLEAGALFDPPEKLGLADFTASALLRGTETRTFRQIFDLLESNAASLGFSASTHMVNFSGRALAGDLSLLLDLLADALFHPIFPSEEIERLRAQFLTRLAIRAQDTADMAALTFDQILFEGHPYSQPEDGWPETIQALQREDLVAFHRRCYGPRNMVLAVVGAVDSLQVVEQVEAFLGSWQNPAQQPAPSLPPFQPLERLTRRDVFIPGKSQSDIVLGGPGPRRADPDFMSAALGNSILGQFGLGGRIGETVREKSGLAYYASSSLNAGVGPGSWEAAAGVNPKNVEKTIHLLVKEIRRFVQQGVSPEELADSQSQFIGRLPLSLESNQGVLNALLNIERYGLGLDYYQRYADLVRAVTVEQVV
ncbi:MAG: insulinase family protein, partial [Anaerolineales bacterium]|nr:insulinase family protein [Anaerolineales bacterium]